MAKISKFKDKKLSRPAMAAIHGLGRLKKKEEQDDRNFFKVFSILSLDDTNELIHANTESTEKILISFLHLNDPTINLQEGIILDYYIEGILFAREQEFNSAKFSGFFTVLHEMLVNIKEKQFNFQENIKHFRIYYHGVGLCDLQEIANADLFSIKEAKKIITYFCTTLFQHYALYEYIFTHTQAEELIGTHLKIETPRSLDSVSFPPLIEAVSDSMLDKYKKISPNSEEDKTTAVVPTEDALVPSDETLELLRELTKDGVKEVFECLLSEILPHVQPEIEAIIQERKHKILSRITQLCQIDE